MGKGGESGGGRRQESGKKAGGRGLPRAVLVVPRVDLVVERHHVVEEHLVGSQRLVGARERLGLGCGVRGLGG